MFGETRDDVHRTAVGSQIAMTDGVSVGIDVPSGDAIELPPTTDFSLDLDLSPQDDAELGFSMDSPSLVRQRHLQIHVYDRRFKHPTWMHPNIGGEAQHIESSAEEVAELAKARAAAKHSLSEWTATAISGNDILSSVLFTAGLTAAKAGKYAPLGQAIVCVVTYYLRPVMEEAMSAVPLNGGCYTAVLNSSTKRLAALCALFSILSYLATGVVCAVSAFSYLNTIVTVPIVLSTIGMLFVFAVLCVMGIAESAVVALIFFIFHAVTLTILAVTSIIYAAQHPSVFLDNMKTAVPDTVLLGKSVTGSFATAAVFGYGTAMLGVTGFESSAQFIEEQAPGVFPKTLRNMWIITTVYNMAYSFLTLAVVPLNGPDGIIMNQNTLLAHMGKLTAGSWLEILVCIDAFVVLAGAVLTSYVGIAGLVERLAIDRLFPRLLMRKNAWRNTCHNAIVVYFVVASSLVVTMKGAVDGLAGVLAFAFLGVLGSFVLGCMLLKVYREDIPRKTTTSWLTCCFCFIMVMLGVLANALGNPTSLYYFLVYFVAIGLIVFVMLERVWMLKSLLWLSKRLLASFRALRSGEGAPSVTHELVGNLAIAKAIEKIKRTPAIFFCKAPNLPKINEAITYILRNEQTYCLRLVHVRAPDSRLPQEFEDIVCLFDHIYPSLKIDFVSITGTFEPALMSWITATMCIPSNMMFMRQPATPEMHAVANVGVRVITG
ncbi:TPA: hypothetical protein N0F65_004266 [Lagenidium giganteum]|uniref:Uncharacterized protein n=1 Tax=Lagenidium giganteum TaxID=4803 RepID=A0AAV2ZH40_9STRA|nr:TPA: hypothetical protein N0F65_004266 [Lagenidium giganteum]